VYTTRSTVTQYQESDLAFVERLMHEEGLFYYFEHSGDAGDARFGSHTLVIADHNGSFTINDQAAIAFTQPGATMQQDSLDRWRTEIRAQTDAVELLSWDYRALDVRTASAVSANASGELVNRDAPGVYAYASRLHGQRIADRQMQALEAGKEVHVGAGTVRTLAPGTTFTLTGHPRFNDDSEDDARSFLTVRAVHLMHNNLDAELAATSTQQLGQGMLDALIADEKSASLHAPGKGPGQRPLYRVRIDAIRSKVPYRSRAWLWVPRCQWNCTLMRWSRSVWTVAPDGPTTIAVCCPRMAGRG
jgi:type VI secretion system secreted protein VgrG